MLRFLFLRFLPRRLIPLLTLFEAYRLFRRFQAARKPQPPTRLVVTRSAGDSGTASGRSTRVDAHSQG